MTCEQFVETSFQAKSLATVIEQANTITAQHRHRDSNSLCGNCST